MSALPDAAAGHDAAPLPPRDPEALLPSPITRSLAFVLLGVLAGAAGTVLMALDPDEEGHGHGSGGSPFLMVPHQVLLALPLVVGLVTLLRETKPWHMVRGLLLALSGILLVDLFLAY